MHVVDEIGAHVSSAGGLVNAPARAAALRSQVLQLFTKQPQRWLEPVVGEEVALAFRAARQSNAIGYAGAHDSYLINLASADPKLFAQSLASFRGELQRCTTLGLDFVVTHPGNATDGDAASGLARNADALQQLLEEVSGSVHVLLETTAGCGSVLGASFKQLLEMIERIAVEQRTRIGVCLDTCHVWVAGYDLLGDYHGVFAEFSDTLGIERLQLMHCNDSVGGCGSRRDRHAHIGRGTLGNAFFRQLMQDESLRNIPKLIETPKDDDALKADRKNLAVLRRFRAAAAREKVGTNQQRRAKSIRKKRSLKIR